MNHLESDAAREARSWLRSSNPDAAEIEDLKAEIADLRSLNAELVAACEEVVRIQEIPRCSAAAVALERFAPKLQAVIAKAHQNLQDSQGEAIG